MNYERRIARVCCEMRTKGIDVLLLTPSTDLFYLTGMKGHLFERLSCCLFTQEEVYFISPAFELGNLKEETRGLLSCGGWNDGEDPFRLVDAALPVGDKTIAFGAQVPGWIVLAVQALRPGYACISAEELMRGLRMVKDEEEYRLLKQVQQRSCSAFMRLLEHGVCGMTELQAARLLMKFSEEEGVDSPDGIPIVAAGRNSALPHHVTDDTVICPGDVLLFDFGGENKGEGYIADTSRTFAVKKVSEEFLEIFAIVKEANQAAFEMAKPGIRCCDVDKAAREVIAQAGYAPYFTHRTGHGLGLDVHEHPYISAGSTDTIKAGNAFSDEPGIYLPEKFGVRIEDALFIKKDGAERLTPLDHELHIID